MRTSSLILLLPCAVLVALLLSRGREPHAPAIAAQPLTGDAANIHLPPDPWEQSGYASGGYRTNRGLLPDAYDRLDLLITWPTGGFRSWRDAYAPRLRFIWNEDPVMENRDGPMAGLRGTLSSEPSLAYQDSVLAYVHACLSLPRLVEGTGKARPNVQESVPPGEPRWRHGIHVRVNGEPGHELTMRGWLLEQDSLAWNDPGILVPEPAPQVPMTKREARRMLKALQHALREQHAADAPLRAYLESRRHGVDHIGLLKTSCLPGSLRSW